MADFLVIAAALAAGLLLGVLAGLIPGMHSNTIASLLAASNIDAGFLAFVIVAAFGARTVVEFLPSIFFGIPDQNTVLSVLPGHRLALLGKGIEAVRVCAFSALAAGAAAVLLFPISLAVFPIAYSLVKPFTFPLLLAICTFLIISEGGAKPALAALLVFLMSGVLGMLTLNAPVREVLFPVFAGMFALAGIFAASGGKGEKLKRQEAGGALKADFAKPVGIGVLLGMFADLLPGLGAPAQMAAFASLAVPLEDARRYLALVASIATSHAVFAFSALLTTGKARVGALATLAQLSEPGVQMTAAYVAVFLLGISIGALALLFLARYVRRIADIDFGKLNALVAIYIVCAVFILSGALGLLVLAAAAAVGALPIFLNVRRSHLLGAILVPAMLASAGLLP